MADEDDGTYDARETLEVGACVHLAAMILELQQMALRLGAGDVSSHLQRAYLETQTLQRQHQRSVR